MSSIKHDSPALNNVWYQKFIAIGCVCVPSVNRSIFYIYFRVLARRHFKTIILDQNLTLALKHSCRNFLARAQVYPAGHVFSAFQFQFSTRFSISIE